jgi:sRNA-binding regulator protein Hfq
MVLYILYTIFNRIDKCILTHQLRLNPYGIKKAVYICQNYLLREKITSFASLTGHLTNKEECIIYKHPISYALKTQ